MTRHQSSIIRNVILLLTALISVQATASPEGKRNFVFLLVDDLGWADTGCYGSTFYETPHIDRLAASGTRFTQAYAAGSVCSPTRASILTGRHPVRVDITDWIPGMATNRAKTAKFKHINDRDNLALSEVTIAEELKANGYQTFFAGKWHLGDKGHWPKDQGFDFNIGGNKKGSPPGGYYAPWTNPTLKSKHKGEYLTERLTEESIKFLKTRNSKKPFLLYLSYYNVHTPITPYKKRIAHFKEKASKVQSKGTSIDEHDGTSKLTQDNPAYASMIQAVDDSVGELMAALQSQGLDKSTAVFFFSDNGGLCTLRKNRRAPTSNLPLRSGKGWLYEGGIREPLIISAPGVGKPGSICKTPVFSTDFFPTILELAGLPLNPDLHADGKSLYKHLSNNEDKSPRSLFWHYPHYHGSSWKPGAAIRVGDWKLIEFYHWEKIELYNLATDPGEKKDLSKTHPDKAKELQNKLKSWQKKMKAKMPQRI